MYYYVYDSFVADKEFRRVLQLIETETNNLGLTGERAQTSTLRKADELVKEAAERGYKPIVIVGDDGTLNAAINAVARNNFDVPLAYVPVKKDQPLAFLLGVTPESAIVSLSRRVVRELALAKANQNFFLASINCYSQPQASTRWLPGKSVTDVFEPELLLDEHIRISAPVDRVLIEHKPDSGAFRVSLRNESRGLLRRTTFNEQGIFWAKHIEMKSKKPITCLLDGRAIIRAPLDIQLSDQHVSLIVGRTRRFG